MIAMNRPDIIDLPQMKVQFSLLENPQILTFEDLFQKLKKKLSMKQVLAVRVNREYIRDLAEFIGDDVKTVDFITFEDQDGRQLYWHSSAHLLGLAMEAYFKQDNNAENPVKLCDGPPLNEGGFFYEAYLENGRTITREDEQKLERIMMYEAKKNSKFERIEISKEDARIMFHDNKYKQEILDKIPEDEVVSVYKSGDLIDLCRGPHIARTGLIGAAKIRQTSGIYHKGDKEQEVLQRVYAITFPDSKQMKEWEQNMAERAQRDHRVVGAKQKLWMFHSAAPGNPFFLPHGTRIFTRLIDMMRREYRLRGYEEVISPQMFNKELWKTSGHWTHYRDDMFLMNEKDEHGEECMGLKPMNCPGHCLMFAHEKRSYRELPVRFADFSPLHRNELSGALTGLTRVRRFVQDDAHIFCRRDQVAKEIQDCLQFVKDVYSRFQLPLSFKLSTRPEKFMGGTELWNEAEASLRNALENLELPWEINHGDGAFYGPKIDITVKDSLDRFHQCATIQLDFQLPQQFELKYMSEDEHDARPVMIHRAILGSVERFMAVVTEHFAGKWPFWISPRQAVVIPVSPDFNDYAREVAEKILNERPDTYIDVWDHNHLRFNKKIREAQLNQYNFLLIVGEKEREGKSVAVRTREEGKQIGSLSVDKLIELFDEKTANFE